MFMHKSKKGFTIVELVIVIAVIAILAAVLIPTFSNLVKKANLSNDKSFVRNMNITLAAENTLEKFTSAGDAIDALDRNGFAGKYNTYSSNFHYCYSLENNKMYLLDDTNEVVYPEETVNKSTLWGLYTDNKNSVITGVTKYVAMTNIINSQHYNDAFASGAYTLDLNGYMINVETTLNTVTANNGIVINGATAGEGIDDTYTVVETTTNSEGVLTVYDPQLRSLGEVSGNTVTIKNQIFIDRVHVNTDRTSNYVFENCIFYYKGIQFDDGSGASDGVTGTIKNCQFIDIGDDWAIMTFRSLTVENTTFTKLNSRGAIQVHQDSVAMDITVTDCTFDGTAGEYPIVRFVGKTGTNTRANTGIDSFTVSGCNFNALNKSVGIIGFSGTGSDLYGYTGAAEQPTVTFANNTFASAINGKYLVTEGKYAAAAGNTLGTLLGNSAK